MTPRILYVDREPDIAAGIRWELRDQPLEVVTATSVEEALQHLDTQPVDVVVSSDRMSELRGSEFLSLVRSLHPDTVRLIVTDGGCMDSACKALYDAEVFRFLRRPCTSDELIHCIDQALDARGQRAQGEDEQRGAQHSKHAVLTAAFERALESMWIAFQPIVSHSRGQVCGYEALVRSNDSEIGNPGALFGVAEELERVPELDALIRARVAAEIPDAPDGAHFMVNVHPRSLSGGPLYDRNDPLLEFASRVALEITERSSLTETPGLANKVLQLRELGYRLAIDDLGAGYASLTSIALLQPEVVKLDMGLVRDVHLSPTKAKLVSALTGLCRDLDIETVAEGIESRSEREALADLGCDLMQGFHFARPAPGFMRTIAD